LIEKSNQYQIDRNKDEFILKRKNYYQKNNEKIKLKSKKYYNNNRYAMMEKQKIYREKNKEKFNNYSKIYCEKNKEKLRDYRHKYYKNKRRKDIHYKIKKGVSTLMRIRLHNRLASKEGNTVFNILPYTIEKLIQRLELNFQPGMSWNNYGFYGWHIDHKKADCKFNYKSINDQSFKDCWSLANLQPLWADDNFKKNRY